MSATNVVRVGKRGNICVGNNVSSFARVLTCSTCFQLFNKLLLCSKIVVFLSKDKKLKFMGLKWTLHYLAKVGYPAIYLFQETVWMFFYFAEINK